MSILESPFSSEQTRPRAADTTLVKHRRSRPGKGLRHERLHELTRAGLPSTHRPMKIARLLERYAHGRRDGEPNGDKVLGLWLLSVGRPCAWLRQTGSRFGLGDHIGLEVFLTRAVGSHFTRWRETRPHAIAQLANRYLTREGNPVRTTLRCHNLTKVKSGHRAERRPAVVSSDRPAQGRESADGLGERTKVAKPAARAAESLASVILHARIAEGEPVLVAQEARRRARKGNEQRMTRPSQTERQAVRCRDGIPRDPHEASQSRGAGIHERIIAKVKRITREASQIAFRW